MALSSARGSGEDADNPGSKKCVIILVEVNYIMSIYIHIHTYTYVIIYYVKMKFKWSGAGPEIFQAKVTN